MKIAIICPIGDLNRFGYQRVAQICLESWRAIGDLFLIKSSRSSMPFAIDAIVINNPKTWMSIVGDQERFDHQLVAQNANRGLSCARSLGYEVAITICANWYVEAEAARRLVAKAQRLLDDEDSWRLIGRRMQIKDQLFDVDLCSIAMLNLSRVQDDPVKVLVDRVTVNGLDVVSLRGALKEMNAEAYIDAELELTDAEWFDKMADIRNYEDLLPKRHGVDFNYWVNYFNQRYANMQRAADAPGPIGQTIAALHQPDFFGERWL